MTPDQRMMCDPIEAKPSAPSINLVTSQCPICFWDAPLPGFQGICPSCHADTTEIIRAVRTPAATILPETETRSRIQPLGEQIIIRTLPVGSVGSIIIPDSAKSITMMGNGNRPVASEYLISGSLLEDLMAAIDPTSRRRTDITELLTRAEKARKTPATNNLSNAVHFVEAEVIAVGPGKRLKGDRTLIADLLYASRFLLEHRYNDSACDGYLSRILDLERRAGDQSSRIPPLVQPGDHILYHPAVQKFDRDITSVMQNGNENGSKYFMIREDSVLAVIERG